MRTSKEGHNSVTQCRKEFDIHETRVNLNPIEIFQQRRRQVVVLAHHLDWLVNNDGVKNAKDVEMFR